MNYDTARKLEIHDSHQQIIKRFAQGYRCGQPTILLLPGGMGSHLDRSTVPFKNAQSIPFAFYDPVWIDLELIFGRDADLIEIQKNGHDQGEHVIIPNGALKFLVNAYDGTEKFFRELGWNYLVFGYDWRRGLADAAGQLEEFLSAMRYEVKELRDCDPLPTTTLLAHSQGGLVAKVFLHRIEGADGSGIKTWMERLVTVGTPFYGTSSHQDRYYKGQSPLNIRYGAHRVSEIAASMPGPYILMFADQTTLDRDGAALGLSDYPITDATTNAPADPYDAANFSRYPPWVNREYIEEARDIRETLTAPLPDAIIERVFHIRSGKNAATAAGLEWRAINGATFVADGKNTPLVGVAGEGDGTVPFWSARLAQTPKSQIFNLRQTGDHGGLAEHRETLTVIRRLIANRKLPKPSSVKVANEKLGTQRASSADAEKLVADATAGTIQKSDPRANDPAIWRRIIEDSTLC